MKTAGLALAMALSASPALALQTPEATRSDPRIKTVSYRPSEPVQLIATVGALLEIQLDPGEVVLNVPASDQGLLDGDKPSERTLVSQTSSQDSNLAVAIAGSDILLKALRPLSVQPLFVISRKGDQVRHYTFELRTRDGAQTMDAAPYWVVHFVYPAQPSQPSVTDLSKQEQAVLARQLRAPINVKNTNYTVRGSIP